MKKLSKRAKVRIVKALNDVKFELAKCEHEDAWLMMERIAEVEKDVEYIGEPQKFPEDANIIKEVRVYNPKKIKKNIKKSRRKIL